MIFYRFKDLVRKIKINNQAFAYSHASIHSQYTSTGALSSVILVDHFFLHTRQARYPIMFFLFLLKTLQFTFNRFLKAAKMAVKGCGDLLSDRFPFDLRGFFATHDLINIKL